MGKEHPVRITYKGHSVEVSKDVLAGLIFIIPTVVHKIRSNITKYQSPMQAYNKVFNADVDKGLTELLEVSKQIQQILK